MTDPLPSDERCACVSHDALRCMQIRYNIDPDEDCDKQRCECVCHPEYEDDYDLNECNCGYGCPPGNGCRHD
jgi:hypothetical protein